MFPYYSSKQKFFLLLGFFLINLITIRFFYKYIPYPNLSFLIFLSSIIFICYSSITFNILIRFFYNKLFLFISLFLFIIFSYFSYEYADNLSKIGRGSVNDDCIKIFVKNIFAIKSPYSNMLGFECSLGPSIFIFYFLSYFNNLIFIILPSFLLIFFYLILSQFYNYKLAIFITLINLSNLMFVELSSVGSDFYMIAFVYAFAFIFFVEFFFHKKFINLLFFFIFLILFACSRLPLAFISIFILSFIFFEFLNQKKRIETLLTLLSIIIIFSIWSLVYIMNPLEFISQPTHLFKKFLFYYDEEFSRDFIIYLINFPNTVIWIFIFLNLVIFLFVFIVNLMFLKFNKNLNLLFLFIPSLLIPMFFLSFIDLNARSYNLSLWEGLSYLYLPIPSIVFYLCFLLEKHNFKF